MDFLPLHAPSFGGNEWAYLRECLESGWVSSAGPFVERFERAVAERTGAGHAVATVNGTAALHLALRAIGVSEGDLVIVPALTFVAPVNTVLYCGAAPVFVDADATTLGMAPTAVEAFLATETDQHRDGVVTHRTTGRRVAACLTVHIFGCPMDMYALRAVCDRWSLPVVEDATESVGSTYRGRSTGTLGRIGCFSFNGNKIITAGGGGVVVTDDSVLASRVRHLSTQAKADPVYGRHDVLGYNYRIPALNAALGLAQLEQLDTLLARKRAIAARYRDLLAGVRALRVFTPPRDVESNEWLVTVFVDTDRDRLIHGLERARIQARPIWAPCHRHPYLKHGVVPSEGLATADRLCATGLNLPSSPGLRLDHVTRVAETLRRLVSDTANAQ